MKKNFLALAILTAVFATGITGCSKDDNDNDTAETRTELLAKANWKFEKAEAPLIGDISSRLEACVKDNLLIFAATSAAATSGNGTVDEGPTKCDPAGPQTVAFNWELVNNGTILRSSAVLFPGGSTDFDIVTLNATTLIVSQQVSFTGYPAVTVTFTFKH